MSIWGINIKKYSLFLMDTSIFLLSLYFALSIRRLEFVSVNYFISHIPTFLIIYIIFVAGMYIMGMYEVLQIGSRLKKIKSIIYVTFAAGLFGTTFFYLFHNDYTPKTVLVIQLGLLLTFSFLLRLISDFTNKNKIRLALIGAGKYKDEIEKVIRENNSFEIDNSVQSLIEDFDKYSEKNVTDIIKSKHLNILVLDLSDIKITKLLPSIYDMSKAGIKIMDISAFYEFIFKKTMLSSISYNWFFKEVKVDTKIYEVVKRSIDIILCIPILIVWAILHPWVWWTIKKGDGREVYSIQERVGRYNKKIFIKKYRSMTFTDAGVWHDNSVNKITEVGAFLRKTRIDELPQVFAVLKGDLSFIGPRTDNVNLWKNLETQIENYNLRYSVTPGLSGWAQVNMDYQPRTVEDTRERLKYDLYYIKNRSIILDIIIILKTIKTVLSREGS